MAANKVVIHNFVFFVLHKTFCHMIKSFQLTLKNFFSDFTSNRRWTCEDKYHSCFNDKTNKKLPRKSKYIAEMPILAKN